MKEATTVKKSAATTHLKELATNSVIGVIAFLLAGLVVFLIIWGIRALVYAVIPEEYLLSFMLAATLVCVGVVLFSSLIINKFREKKAHKEYNERLKWQKERLQMSFEERMRGSV